MKTGKNTKAGIMSLLGVMLGIGGCAMMGTVISSGYPDDKSVSVSAIEKDRLPVFCEYYTKKYLDSLPERRLHLIDSSLVSPLAAHGVVLIKSSEQHITGKDVRTDIVAVYKTEDNDTVEIQGNARKFLRNAKEVWAGGNSSYGDNSEAWGSGPMVSFTKVILYSCYEKTGKIFYVELKSLVPTSGNPDTLDYCWEITVEQEM